MKTWMEAFIARMRQAFGDRLAFVGLQGSRARGEATPKSDIDVVVVLDRLEADDISAYRTALEGLPEREKICGFLSGRAEQMCIRDSDKAAFDEEAKVEGTLLDVFFQEGDDVPCLTNVCVIGAPGESTACLLYTSRCV